MVKKKLSSEMMRNKLFDTRKYNLRQLYYK